MQPATVLLVLGDCRDDRKRGLSYGCDNHPCEDALKAFGPMDARHKPQRDDSYLHYSCEVASFASHRRMHRPVEVDSIHDFSEKADRI